MKNKFTNAERSKDSVDIACEKCGATFKINRLKKTVYSDGIEISYFVCEKCGHKYAYLVTDGNLRKAIKRNKAMPNQNSVSSLYIKEQSQALMERYSDRVEALDQAV